MMAALLFGVIVRRERGRQSGLFETSARIEPGVDARLIGLGFPAASQITLEVGVFAAATALAGRLPGRRARGAPDCDQHRRFYVHGAARRRLGRRGARRAGDWTTRSVEAPRGRAGPRLLFGAGFMACSAAVFLLLPAMLIGAFTSDPRVLEVGVSLLMVAAVFQLFDGLQAVATGVLRGLGDTRTPMIWNLAGHWFVGLPLGYVLCFTVGLGVIGLWWGLSTGLIICGVSLLAAWSRRIDAASALLPQQRDFETGDDLRGRRRRS